ncbi:Probable carboxyvinyl-carboxyphosphonate phosphorylmutase, partial [hydrothermal vent metagenome]
MTVDNVKRFAELHIPEDPLILYNIWDAGSAIAVEAAGAKALATGSRPVAGANGSEDGEHLPFSRALDNARAIVSNVSVPVSIDMETGYGDSPEEVGCSAAQMASVGVVGANIEDQILGENA